MSNSTSASTANIPVHVLPQLFGSQLLVTLTDGRTAKGKFISLDRSCNIILEDVVECREVVYVPHAPTDKFSSKDDNIFKWSTEREVTLAVIPGDRLERVQICKKELDAKVTCS
mmetsp:Transcript_1203/g.2799  ORF Transcript_1203/g.2799 Transcript_1203/m.2799 type:complete len:114 (-) Transcript_1203:1272-1613(-)|eukprot:scaffold2852_cov189-Alexandrium_tamarense.AAC.12